MTQTADEPNPFGRGFVAACIVIGAILLCGVLLIFAGRPGATASSAAAADLPAATPPATGPAVTGPAAPAVTGPASPASATDPAASRVAPEVPRTATGCGLPDGDQTVPLTAPPVDGWEVSRRVVVPRSASYGPGTVDPDGFRRCFAHSPRGALFAAYSAVSALADQRRAAATVTKLMVPGPATDALVKELRPESASASGAVVQLAGYRVVDASRDRTTVTLATAVDDRYVSLTLTLVWRGGDWLLAPPRPGEAVGTPYAQHRDLSDFVAWSGL